MTQREKILAAMVGGLVVVIVLFFGLKRVLAGFDLKNDKIQSLYDKTLENQTTILKGTIARKRLNEYATRSLPSDLESAKNTYSTWLINFAKANKLNNAQVDPKADLTHPDKSFDELVYTLGGRTRLDDAIKLVYAFYEFPYLHKVNHIEITPDPKEYGVVKLHMDIAVAVIKEANKTQAAPDPKQFKIMERPVQEYLDTIVQRNIFYPANKAPNWSKTASTDVHKGSDLSYELKASDPDANQKVTYEIIDSTAEGAKIRDGKLVWSPKSNGEFSVTVRATDSGLPAASSTQKIAIKVGDPPAKVKPVEAPKFDVATQTRVTALLSGKSGPEAWFLSRTDGKRVSVHIGDKFDLAGITGTVTEIGASFVEIETDGRRWIIGQDESLADAYKRGQFD